MDLVSGYEMESAPIGLAVNYVMFLQRNLSASETGKEVKTDKVENIIIRVRIGGRTAGRYWLTGTYRV